MKSHSLVAVLCSVFVAALAAVPRTHARPAAAEQSTSSTANAKTVSFETTEGTWISLDVSRDGQRIVFELLGDLYSLPIAGGTASPFIRGLDYASQPRFSPSGTRIAFISDGTGSDNIWIANADGSNPHPVTTQKKGLMLSPAWSSDEKKLYATLVGGLAPRIADLWEFDVATGAGEALIKNANGAPSQLVSSPAPGPYSAHAARATASLYFTSVTPRAYGVRAGAASRIVRFDLGDKKSETLVLEGTNPMKPVLSPDGKALVYGAEREGRAGLKIKELSSGVERWLAFPVDRDDLEARGSRDLLPDFSFTPDGDAVIAAFGGGIHRIDVRSGVHTLVPFRAQVSLETKPPLDFPRRVEEGSLRPRFVQQLSFARDGRVAFSTLGRIYVADKTLRASRRLTKTEAPREFQPAWSPDGSWIAFITWGADGGQIWKSRADGAAPPIQLTKASAFYTDLAWTPDGGGIVALRSAEGIARLQPFSRLTPDAEIIRVGASGDGAVTRIGTAGSLRRPHFAKEVDRFFAFSAADGLVSMKLDGSDRRVHATLSGLASPQLPGSSPEAILSPDGSTLALRTGERLIRFTLPMESQSARGAPFKMDLAATALNVVSSDAPEGIAWQAPSQLVWTTGNRVHGLEPTEAGGREIAVDLPRQKPVGSVVLRNARVITMRGNEVLERADVLVTENRIAAVGPSGTITIPPGAASYDFTGRTVMPGIIDIHAHWSSPSGLGVLEPEFPSPLANLAYGVTTVRDPQTLPDIFQYSDLAEIGEMPSPRIYSTGPGVFEDAGLKSLDDAIAKLRRYTERYKTHLIKSYLVGTRQQRQWMVEACRTLGLMPTTEGGSDSKLNLTHAIDGFSGNEHALPQSPLYRDVTELFSRTGITYTPTLLVAFGGPFPIYRFLAEENPSADPKLRRFFPQEELYQRTATRLLAFRDEDHRYREQARGAAEIMRAGGHVAVGGHGEMQGLQNHWEMRLFVEGGMTPHEALRAATIEGARAIGLAQDLGSIEVGKLADLVVLDQNPLADIRASSGVQRVMKNGVLYDANTLATLWPKAVPGPKPWWQRQQTTEKQAFDSSAVDAAVRNEMERQRIPGVGLAVIRRGETLVARGYGSANLEHQNPATDETMFQTGSLGKQFTAAGVMALVEDGKVRLTDSVRRYLKQAPESWEPMQIRHLLSHTSGIPDYTTEAFDYRKDYTEDELATLAFAQPLEFVAGSRWNYSNTGYVMLGIIIHNVTGKPYWEFLRERIFTPAGMKTARVISESAVVPHRASGYLPDAVSGGFVHQNWVSPLLNTTADGSMLVSVRDLVAWNEAVRTRSVLKATSWEEMLKPITLNSGKTYPYGFAWFIDEQGGQAVHQHGGSWQGFRTQFTRFVQDDIAIAVLTNSGRADPGAIANAVASAIDTRLGPNPRPTKAMADDPKITAYVREVVLRAQNGSLSRDDFSYYRMSILPRMQAALQQRLKDQGPPVSLELLSKKTLGDDEQYVYRSHHRATKFIVTVAISPQGKLTDIMIAAEPQP